MSCSYCGKESKKFVHGLCLACYRRKWQTGSLEYKRWHKPKKLCTFDGCMNEHVAKGLCEMHYKSQQRNGTPVPVFGYGDRKKHPAYEAWRSMGRSHARRVKEWDDFWMFVQSIPEKPTEKCMARRVDAKKEWGPENFYWRIYQVQDPEDKAAGAREYREKNQMMFKDRSLRRAFGISLENYLKMYDNQEGKCKICGKPGETFSSDCGRSKTLVVDHCHETKKVRALLCSSCNKGLGCFGDDEHTLENAKQYILEFRKLEGSQDH